MAPLLLNRAASGVPWYHCWWNEEILKTIFCFVAIETADFRKRHDRHGARRRWRNPVLPTDHMDQYLHVTLKAHWRHFAHLIPIDFRSVQRRLLEHVHQCRRWRKRKHVSKSNCSSPLHFGYGEGSYHGQQWATECCYIFPSCIRIVYIPL